MAECAQQRSHQWAEKEWSIQACTVKRQLKLAAQDLVENDDIEGHVKVLRRLNRGIDDRFDGGTSQPVPGLCENAASSPNGTMVLRRACKKYASSVPPCPSAASQTP